MAWKGEGTVGASFRMGEEQGTFSPLGVTWRFAADS